MRVRKKKKNVQRVPDTRSSVTGTSEGGQNNTYYLKGAQHGLGRQTKRSTETRESVEVNGINSMATMQSMENPIMEVFNTPKQQDSIAEQR